MEETRIKFKEKLGYGFGDFANNLVWIAISAFLTFFYTDVVGFSAAAVGTLLLIARVLDAFVDLGVGTLVDKTKSKYGKARPWLLWLAIPFGISGVLLFSAPNLGPTGALIYAYATYLLVNIIYSGVNVPYSVLNSLITQEPYERSLLNIYRMVMALVGGVVVTYFTMPLVSWFGGGKTGWAMTFAVFGILAAVLLIITFITTKERVKPSVVQKDIPLRRSVKTLFRNKYCGLIVGFMVVTYTSAAVSSGVNVYYAQYLLKDASLVGIIGLASSIPLFLGLFMVAPIIKKFGKRNASFTGIIITIIGLLFMLIDPVNLTIILIGLVIKAVGSVPMIATMFAMLADTVDYGEWKTGMRTEGLVYSAGSFGLKVGSGLGAAFVGWLLAWGGYVGGLDAITDSAKSSIVFMFIYLPIIAALIQLIILWFYKLDKKYPQIVQELNEIKTL